jgi:hypothetical protein
MSDETLPSKVQGLREAHGPRGLPLVGVLPQLWLDILGFFITSAHRYGDVVRFKFDPERFSPVRSRGRPRYVFFPFGGGHHTCLGMYLAMMEMTIVTAMGYEGICISSRSAPSCDAESDPHSKPRQGIKVLIQAR